MSVTTAVPFCSPPFTTKQKDEQDDPTSAIIDLMDVPLTIYSYIHTVNSLAMGGWADLGTSATAFQTYLLM